MKTRLINNRLIIYFLLILPILISFFEGINNDRFIPNSESILAWESWFYSSGLSMYYFGIESYLSSNPSIFLLILSNLGTYYKSDLFLKIDFPHINPKLASTDWSIFDSFGIRLEAKRVYIDYVDHGMSIFNFLAFRTFGPLVGAPYLFLYLLILVSVTITFVQVKKKIVLMELSFGITCFFIASTIFLQYSESHVFSPITYRFIGIVGLFPLIYLFNLKNIVNISNINLYFWSSLQVCILFLVVIAHSQSFWQVIILVFFLTLYKVIFLAQNKQIIMLLCSIVFLISLILIFTSTVPSNSNQVKSRLIWHSIFMGLNALPERQIDGISLGRERGVYEDWNAFNVGYKEIPENGTWKYIFGNTREYEKSLKSTVFHIIQNHPFVFFKAFFYKLIQFANMLWYFIFNFVLKDIRTVIITLYALLFIYISNHTSRLNLTEFHLFTLSSLLLSTLVVTFITYPQTSNTIQSISIVLTYIIFNSLYFTFSIFGRKNA